jgi:4-hydroxy-4-methyl-2-oxoglutarate aldolase
MLHSADMVPASERSDITRRLVEFGVATVHEALGRRGLIDGIRLMVGPAFAGVAATVAIPAGDNLGIHALFERIEPGSVACIASGGQGVFGVYGDLLHDAGRVRGLAAVVIDDGLRDLAQLAAPPSVAARGTSARGTVKGRVPSLGAPVVMGRVLVRPGDWILGDSDGICVVPAERLNDALKGAAARTAKEGDIRLELRAGRTTVDVLGLAKLMRREERQK